MTAADVRGELAAALLSPDGSLVAIRRGDNDWRVSNGGHYRDKHVEDWTPLIPLPVVDRIAGKRAAEKLRAMAAELSDSDQYVEIALGGAAYVQTWLSDRAAALDAEEGQ